MCGSPDIPLHLLKSVATYKGTEPGAPLVQWFWEVMETLSTSERSLFLRFVWGRTRLPRTIADFRGRDFVIQVWLPFLEKLETPTGVWWLRTSGPQVWVVALPPGPEFTRFRHCCDSGESSESLRNDALWAQSAAG